MAQQAQDTRTDVKPNRRIVRVTKVGNGRYLSFGRVLPFLKAGDIVDVEAYIYSVKDWYVQVRPMDNEPIVSHIRKTVPIKRTKRR